MNDLKNNIKRYDLSEDRSLQAWSAADEYLLQYYNELEKKAAQIVVYNDRFGFLGCQLNAESPLLIITHKSQEKAVNANLKANFLSPLTFSNPIAELENKADLALIKIPKSLGMFQLFLEQIVHNSTEDITVVCSFMTRHFSPKLLEIANRYFGEVEQSRAVKKSRLLTLSKKRKPIKQELINFLSYNDQKYQQYLGVFSAEHIDYATQFFLDHVEVSQYDQNILDLASGNGIIGNEISQKNPNAQIHLMDDAYLAVASAQLNVMGENIHHHFNNELSIFKEESFDLIVTNPPFHFEHEINIQVPLELFRGCYRCLKKGGNLQMVASKHLNYQVHLEKQFSLVQVASEDKKFVIYKCVK